MSKGFLEIYERLYANYGPQHWWPAETAFEMLVGAILVQNTKWTNVEKALTRLRPLLHPDQLGRLTQDELADLIRPSGFFNVKAGRIQAFLNWFKKYDYNIEKVKELDFKSLRHELLNISGIGKETADCMLVYAFDKPIFIVDAYARRLFYRIGFRMPDDYDEFRKQVEDELPNELQIYNEYHALIVEHGKVHCRKLPVCAHCPLLDICERRL